MGGEGASFTRHVPTAPWSGILSGSGVTSMPTNVIPAPALIARILDAAREYRDRAQTAPEAQDDPTLVAVGGDGFLAQRLGRKPTEVEAELFWAEVGAER